MELSDLTVFRTVVEQGGINKASEVLHRVPSNVTARIQKLESEIGQPLFFREKNRLKIAPAGEHLLTYANQLLSLADEALESLNQAQPSGTLKVGCMEAVAATRLSPFLCEYHQRYPEVKLAVNTGATGVLIDRVLEGELDLALVADPSEDSRLMVKPVFKERLVLVVDRSKR